ncbi:SUMO ligase siz1, partial [Rhizophlyctis rosea]
MKAYICDLTKAVFDGALTFGCFAALPLFMIVVRYAEIYMRAPFKECILLWLKVLTKHGARSGPTTLQPGHTSQISDYYLKKRHQLSEALQAARAQQQQTGRPTSVGPLDITPEPITQRDNTAVSITPTVRPLPEGHTPWLVDTLVSPVTISRPEKGANTKVVFVLSEARFQALRDAAATTITTAITHPFRVRLNMYKPTDLAKRTEWPLPMSHIEVNGSKLLLERKMIRRSRDGAIVVGKNRASDISEFLRCGPNVLWVSFGEGPDSGREWCLEVEFLRYLEVEGVRECVLGTRLDRGFTEGRVKAMLQSGDEDVVQESVPIDLRCALTYTRVKTPVRGTGCTHLECFDLDNFLEAARGVEIPGCPVCGRRVTADA